MQLTPLCNPVTRAIFESTVVLPTGFTSKAFNHATTSENFVRDAVNFAYRDKDFVWGDFAYDGPLDEPERGTEVSTRSGAHPDRFPWGQPPPLKRGQVTLPTVLVALTA